MKEFFAKIKNVIHTIFIMTLALSWVWIPVIVNKFYDVSRFENIVMVVGLVISGIIFIVSLIDDGDLENEEKNKD